jgi:hypothetical protein
MTWWRRLAQSRLWDVGAVTIGVLAIVKIALMLPSRAVEHDFNLYYLGSRMVLNGSNPYRTPLRPLATQYGFVSVEEISVAANPPTILLLFTPLALLEPRPAFWTWVSVQAASLAAILWLTWRLLGERLSARGRLFLCVGVVASAPVYAHFVFSHIELPLAALVLFAYAWHVQGRQTAACLALTAAGVVKLYPFVLLPWLWWRNSGSGSARAVRTGLILAVGLLVVLLTGVERWRDFFLFAMPMHAHWWTYLLGNFSLPSLLTKLGYATHVFALPQLTGAAWAAAVGAALLVACYAVCWRTGTDSEAEFCLLSIAMVTGLPVAWGYYYVFLIFPVGVAVARLAAAPSALRIGCFVVLLALMNSIEIWTGPFWERHGIAGLVWNHRPLYGALGLGLFFLHELRKHSVRQ